MHNSLTLKRQGYLLTNKYIHYICADKINAMIKTNLFLLLFVLLAGTSCNRHTFRAEVENDFRAKQAALPDGNLLKDDVRRKRGAYFLVCLYADRRYHGL